jgi:AcrR family transcriptional regulator
LPDAQEPTHPGIRESTSLRERKKRSLRRRILDVAERFFVERGYAETRISDIAAAVETGEATLYRYFSSKEDIVTDVSAHLMEIPCALAALVGQGTIEAQLRGMLSGVPQQALDCVGCLKRSRGTPVGANVFGGAGPAAERGSSVFAKALRIAQVTGRITPRIDAGILTELFAVMLNAVVLEWARTGSPQELQPRIDAVLRIFLHGALERDGPPTW